MASVFLSHSSKDKPFVRELYRRLRRDGVDCFFDEESIEWGANWVTALEDGIDRCEHILLVLSPDFVASKWSQVERTSGIADNPDGAKRKLLPLKLRDCETPRFLKNIQALDVSTDEQFENNYPKICQRLGGTVRPDPGLTTDHSKLPPVVDLPPCSWMPHRSLGDRFIGRVRDLWELHDQLTAGKTAVVQGVGLVMGAGGLGKSQLAIEYVHRFGYGYPGGVFWIEADQGLARLVSVIANAAHIDFDGKAPIQEQVQAIWRSLNKPNASLVVLDNFPENEALQPWLPPTGPLHVLATTRRRDLGSRYPGISLPFLSREDGLQLLNSGRRTHGAEAEQLVDAVGGLPLALEILRDYLDNRTDILPAMVLEEFDATGTVELLDEFAGEYRDELPSGHEKSVLKTFELSWKLASEEAREVLAVMAQLAPTPVPRRFLRAILGVPEATALRDPLGQRLIELRRLSLIDFDIEQDPFAHRLVLGFLRHRQDIPELRARVVQKIQQEMEAAFGNPDAAAMGRAEALLPHAELLLTSSSLAGTEAVHFANRIARHHQNLGRYVLARIGNEQAVERAKIVYPAGDPSIGTLQSNLALVLKDLGDLEEARDLLREALASAERSFAPGHPSIARSQSNLAMALKDLGDLEEARDLLREALASAERSFAPGHPSIATRQSNLALVLQDLGDLEEARDLLREALASAERSFAPGHPSIATRQSNLAMVLQDLGDLEEARDLLREALASAERSFAPGHPSIARSQSNLAMVLKDLGDLEEARDLLREALASAERSFAPGHPSIARSQSNLAMVLKDLGDLEEARDLLREALASAERSFAPGHPSIATRQSNLASVLQALGDLEEARSLLEKAYESFLAKFGPDHPSTGTVKGNLDSLDSP